MTTTTGQHLDPAGAQNEDLHIQKVREAAAAAREAVKRCEMFIHVYLETPGPPITLQISKAQANREVIRPAVAHGYAVTYFESNRSLYLRIQKPA